MSTKFVLSKPQRLLKPAEFQQVYASKKWGRNANLIFNIAFTQTPFARLGITVSKKVSKRAVVRNRIKRQIREFFRHNQTQLSQCDLIISAGVKCDRIDNKQLRSELDDLWKKILNSHAKQ